MSFTVVSATDTTGESASYLPLIKRAVEAAGRQWQKFLRHDRPIEIEVEIAEYAPVGTATANANDSQFVGVRNGFDTYRWGTIAELQTGEDINGSTPDMKIIIDPTYLREELWFDPTPDTNDYDAPTDRFDAVWIMMHEIGHGLGFEGWRDWSNWSTARRLSIDLRSVRRL